MLIALLCWLAASACAVGQVIDLRMDFQTNSVMQLESAADGTVWGITSSNIDRLPTIAGVWAVRSTDGGTTWDTSCITADWWRWGVDIAAVSATSAYAIVKREDTVALFRVTDARSWRRVDSAEIGIGNPFCLHFFTRNVGVIIGTQGRRIERKWVVARTTDGGTTWVRSIPLLADPPVEQLATLNDRATGWSHTCLCIAMNSGRMLVTTDAGVTWQFHRSPIGRVSGVAVVKQDSTFAFRLFANRADGTVTSGMWTPSGFTKRSVHPSVKRLDGVRILESGAVVSVPRSLSGIECVDVDSGVPIPLPARTDALLEVNGFLFSAQDLVPGRGLVKVKVP